MQLWRDLNQDGISQAEELSTLAAHNIVRIGLTPDTTAINLGNGNTVTGTDHHGRRRRRPGGVGRRHHAKPARLQASPATASPAPADAAAQDQALAEAWFQHWHRGWLGGWKMQAPLALPAAPAVHGVSGDFVSLDQQVQLLIQAMATFNVPAGPIEPGLPMANSAHWPQCAVAAV